MSTETLQCCVAYNKHGGYCIPLASRHRPCAQTVLAGNVWEPETLAFMTSSGGNIIHAGTYFGDFLPALSRSREPGAKVWAFEPNPENYRCALITTHINGLGNVELFNAGLGDRRAVMPMRLKDERGRALGGMSQILTSDFQLPSSDVGTVELLTIDEVFRSDRTVSIIQLDLEGFETQALMGARETIRRSSPVLILESVPDEQWLAAHLGPLGYRAERKIHDNTVFVRR